MQRRPGRSQKVAVLIKGTLRKQEEQRLQSLRLAVGQLQTLLADQGISENEVMGEFRRA